MTNSLKEKLALAKKSYQQKVEQYQYLQHQLISQAGAIDALEELLKEQEADASKSE